MKTFFLVFTNCRKAIFLTLFAAIFAMPVYSQIIYTDVSPDVKITEWDKYSFNLFYNADSLGYGHEGNFDIWKHPTEVVLTSWSCEVLIDSYGFPLAMNEGDAISEESTDGSKMWAESNYTTLNGEGTTGNWIGKQDKYLGLRTRIDGSWYYGWARLDVDSKPDYFIIKDYAGNSAPDEMIKAGDKGLSSVNDNANTNDGAVITVDKKVLNINMMAASPYENEARIFNLTGIIVKEFRFNGQSKSTSLQDLTDGLYIIRISTGGHAITQKIMVD